MAIAWLDYPLVDGYIHHWLMAGPHGVPVTAADSGDPATLDLLCPPALLSRCADLADAPAEGDALDFDGTALSWQYMRCLDDHWLDASATCPAGQRLQAYAYAQVVSPSPQEVTLVLTANGPAALYLNGRRVLDQENCVPFQPRDAQVQAPLQQGPNPLLICFGALGEGETPCTMALRVESSGGGNPESLSVRLPTHVQRPDRRLAFEQVFEHAYLTSPVVYKGDIIDLYWADDLPMRWKVAYSVQDERRRTYLNGTTEAQPAGYVNVGHPARLWERLYYVTLRPHPREYFEEHLRYERRLPIYVLDTRYSQTPYGTYGERRQEALEHAAKREDQLFGEIAKMALGRWPELNADLISEHLRAIGERQEGSETSLLALLGALYRFEPSAAFPAWLREAIEPCACHFRYWLDQPGEDGLRFATEGRSILFHTCELLAGQRYADRMFTLTGETGQWHRLQAEQRALVWLRNRGTLGFREWDSNASFAECVLALSHLSDLAEHTEVRELAAIVMDKLLFTMALNSYKGSFGSSHGYTRTPMILSAQLEATSGISRLLWGMGVWNPHIAGAVSLACSQYELPPILAVVAMEQREEMWNRERHVFDPAEWPEAHSLGAEVNKVTYKTPDYMLSSAQDYHPGERGGAEHIWQATLGADAVVFVNHPACMSEHDAHRPGFWRGNVVLPRVAQWKDVLVAVYLLPENDRLGFTHAYFPLKAFDEHAFEGGWALARKGKGYLALTASGGLELVKRGPGAYRELRAFGSPNIWICQMGRLALDGTFGEFRRKVMAIKIDWQGLAVRLETLRHQTLEFGWAGPLRIDGAEQPLGGYKHYDNPYCVADFPLSEMEIHWEDSRLSLDFS